MLESVSAAEPFVDVRINSECTPVSAERMLHHLAVDLGPLAAGSWFIRVFNRIYTDYEQLATLPLRVWSDDGCVPSPTVLCLGGGRFRVEATYQGFQGGGGDGQAIPLADRDDTGLFWFFAADNVELTVKVLDGCGVNGRYWVFLSPGSNVAWQVRVTDTAADESQLYENGLGELPGLTADTATFDTCP